MLSAGYNMKINKKILTNDSEKLPSLPPKLFFFVAQKLSVWQIRVNPFFWIVLLFLWPRGWTYHGIASILLCSQALTWGEISSSFSGEPRHDRAGDLLSCPLRGQQGCEPVCTSSFVGYCWLPLLKTAFCNSTCTSSFSLRCVPSAAGAMSAKAFHIY